MHRTDVSAMRPDEQDESVSAQVRSDVSDAIERDDEIQIVVWPRLSSR